MPTERLDCIPRWKFPEWQPQFQDVVLEFDSRKLTSLAEAASVAIFTRLKSPETTTEELRALRSALRSIRAITIRRLARPKRI